MYSIPTGNGPHVHSRCFAAIAATILAATGSLAGCAAALPPDPQVISTATSPDLNIVKELPRSRPTGMRIPSAGIMATRMVNLKLDASGAMGVPDPDTAADTPGWWEGSVTPGEKGVAILVAHFDTIQGPALMENVKNIKLGDTVEVPRVDGRTPVFRIREIENVNKREFPTRKVYGHTRRSELRLITCGGPIRNGHRANNIILYAYLAGVK